MHGIASGPTPDSLIHPASERTDRREATILSVQQCTAQGSRRRMLPAERLRTPAEYGVTHRPARNAQQKGSVLLSALPAGPFAAQRPRTSPRPSPARAFTVAWKNMNRVREEKREGTASGRR